MQSNSVTIEDVPLSFLPPGCDPALFTRYIIARQRQKIRTIESTHNVTIIFPTIPDEPLKTKAMLVFEIQSKTPSEGKSAMTDLTDQLKTIGDALFFAVRQIRKELIKFVIGRGGAHVQKIVKMPDWNGRLTDIVIGGSEELVSSDGDEEEELILVVNRKEFKNQKDAEDFITKVVERITGDATIVADLKTKIITIDAKWHGRLKGRKGENTLLKELSIENNVVVKFPPGPKKDIDAVGAAIKSSVANATLKDGIIGDQVVVKGRHDDVEATAKKLLEVVQEWKHIELMNSFCETITVAKSVTKRLVGVTVGFATPGGLSWLVKSIKEKFQGTKEASWLDINAKDLHIRVEVTSREPEDQLEIFGPQKLVGVAKEMLLERAKVTLETMTVFVDVFDVVCKRNKDCLDMMAKEGDDLKQKVLRRIIGKEGKTKKKLEEKHSARIWFKGNKGDGEDSEDANVEIRGSKADVENARAELLDLVEFEVSNGCSNFERRNQLSLLY